MSEDRDHEAGPWQECSSSGGSTCRPGAGRGNPGLRTLPGGDGSSAYDSRALFSFPFSFSSLFAFFFNPNKT